MSRPNPSPLAVAETATFVMIGAVAELHRCVPRLVASRKAKWDQQVTLARFLGQMAVGQAQQQLRRRMTATVTPTASRTSAQTASATGPQVVQATTATMAPTAASATLPIGHYDELSASQVLDRLEHLTVDELDAVHDYESQHRRRRTVLGRIAQLRQSREG